MGNNRSKRGVSIVLLVVGLLFVVGILLIKNKKEALTFPVTERWLETPDSIIIHTDSIVEPIVYRGSPNMHLVSGSERKERFINMMLPSILIAQKKIEEKQREIERLSKKVKSGRASSQDSIVRDSLLQYFKCKDLKQLKKNLHNHPVSIILAQAAIESGWGTSRFFLEANNVFGIWSYNKDEDRIKASATRGETAIYLRKYDNVYGSVYDYLITVARAPAYRDFRNERIENEDPMDLILHLRNYSEMRDEYVKILRKVIRYNNLSQYDSYQLANIDDDDPVWKSL